MLSRSRVLTAGLITLAAGLILFFPARVAYQWFVPESISLAGIDGSVWNGQAREAYSSGVYMREVTWKLRPASILTGQFSFAVAARARSGFVDANVGLGITGNITFTDVQASWSLQTLEQALRMPGLRGEVNARFERLKIIDGLPVVAKGTLEVADLVAPTVYRSSIGGYRAEFFTQESGVMASIEDTDGVVDLAGSLQISGDRSYQFVAQLAAKSNTPATLREQMRFLGSSNDRGQYELRIEGQL